MSELTPEDRERIYLEEKERLEARRQLESEAEIERKTFEAKQRYYKTQSPWKRPTGFAASTNTEGKQSGNGQITGLQSCGLIIAVALVGMTILLMSSSSHSSYDPSPSNTSPSTTPSYTAPTPSPTIANSTFADKEMYEIMARLSQKTGESDERVHIILTTTRQALADKGINETLIEYARNIDGILPNDMNGQKVGLVGVCALYNVEKKMNRQGKGLFGQEK